MRDNTFWYGEVRRETAYLRIPTDSYSVERIYHLEGNRTDKIIMITRPHITSLSEKEFGVWGTLYKLEIENSYSLIT